uniref:Microtubule-associated protein n=1 Tax=Acrobeloides nanus TaxID=290746 RepID=A0A914CTV4_9BILA
MTEVDTPQGSIESDESNRRLEDPNFESPRRDFALPSASSEPASQEKSETKSPTEDIEPKFDKITLQGYTSISEPVNGTQVIPENLVDKTKEEQVAEKRVPDIEVNSESIEVEKHPQTIEVKSEVINVPTPVRSFRPPITPSNSLAYAPAKKKSTPIPPKSDFKPRASTATSRLSGATTRPTPKISTPLNDKMRSSSARPRPSSTQASTATPSSQPSSSRKLPSNDVKTPSLPATPKTNKKYENVKSRINASSDHKPTGSNVKIFHQPVKFNVTSKVGSLQNAKHVPGGGNVKIENRKINFKETAKPKIDAKADPKAPQPEKKIVTQKLEWKAQSKVGSLENANHKPPGGDVKISEYQVTTPKSRSKDSGSVNSIGSHSSLNSSTRRSFSNAPVHNNNVSSNSNV